MVWRTVRGRARLGSWPSFTDSPFNAEVVESFGDRPDGAVVFGGEFFEGGAVEVAVCEVVGVELVGEVSAGNAVFVHEVP